MTVTGHELAAQIIRRHGIDRYPDVMTQGLKASAELGELHDAILKHWCGHDGCGRLVGRPDMDGCPHITKEYADAGLALYELGNKLGLDLITCMASVVEHESRRFSADDLDEGHDPDMSRLSPDQAHP